MPRKSLAVAVGTVVVGLAMVLAGWTALDYAQAVLLQIGSAFLLATPLVYFGRLLEANVRSVRKETAEVASELQSVRDEVRSTTARLDDLTAATHKRLQNISAADDRAFEEYQAKFGRDSLVAVIHRALRVHAILPAGVRVAASPLSTRLRFRLDMPDPGRQDCLLVAIERIGGPEGTTVEWTDTQGPDEFMEQIALELQRMNAFPGVASFNPTRIFQNLLSTVQVAISAKREGSLLDLAPVIEIPGRQWAITAKGLDCLEYPYGVEIRQLKDEDMHVHIRKKTWVDADDLDTAWNIALELHVLNRPAWLQPTGMSG